MNNDLISRSALKDALSEAHINRTLTFDIATFGCVMKIIDLAPTVEAYTEEDAKQAIKDSFDSGYEMAKNKYERPQGEWEFVSRNCWKCSYCQELTNEGKNFCPHCGAEMEGEEE